MADQKLTALTELSVPALTDILYAVDAASGTPASWKVTGSRLFGQLNHICQGRLTLTSGVAVTTSDVTGATSVYFTPYLGQCVAVYDGTRWRMYTFTELTLALGTLTSATNYDVFLWDSSGTLTLVLGPAWTSDTARGTGAGTTQISLQNGVYVNTVSLSGGPGAKAGRYLGTLRTTSTTTTEDSAGGVTTQVGGKRFLWNRCNRVVRHAGVFDSTSSWSYGSATWRQMNGASGNKVEFVLGLAEIDVRGQSMGAANVSGGIGARCAIGLDRTNGVDSVIWGEWYGTSSSNAMIPSFYSGYPSIGYHYLAPVESVKAGTPTFLGSDSGNCQVGLITLLEA